MIFTGVMVLVGGSNGLFVTNYYLFHVLVLGIFTSAIWVLLKTAQHDRRESVLLFFALGYCAFHFGIIPIYVIMPEAIDTIGFNLFLWYSRSELMVPAYSLASIYLAGLVASLLLPMIYRGSATLTPPVSVYASALARVALLAMMGFIVAWCYIVLTTGLGGYDILMEGLQESGRGALIGFIHSAIGISFVLTVVMAEKPRTAAIIFALWASLAFPLGLRGHVAFPALLAVALLSSQGRFSLNPWRIVLLALVFLFISSAVAVFRISTPQDTLEGSVSIARGIAELGGSIRPAYEVVDWVSNGDSLQWGNTYFAPLERTFLRIFPIAERISAESDSRLMNVLIVQRAGPYGFSIAAEAFYNFGYIGCFLLGLLSGWGARLAGRFADRRLFRPVALALTFALFVHIRQSFVTSYGVFMGSIVLLVFIWLVARGLRQWQR